MTTTLQEVLQEIAAFINQDPTLPTGTDLSMWISLVNHAQNEWALSYQWKQLRGTFYPAVVDSQASVALPATFKKLMSPLYDLTTNPPTKYYEISPSERFQHVNTDKYVFVMGNDVTGYSLNINPVFASGASISADYQSFPSSLATYADVVTCPSGEYLVHRTIASILAARSDPRFPQMAQDADEILANLIEEEAAQSGGFLNRTPNQYANAGFRVGES